MPLAFANMAFNLRQVGGNEVAVHTHNNPSAEACSAIEQGGGKWRRALSKSCRPLEPFNLFQCIRHVSPLLGKIEILSPNILVG
jgi:hypothetical protein